MDDNKIYRAELKRALKLQRSVTFTGSYGLRSVDGENYQHCRQDD